MNCYFSAFPCFSLLNNERKALFSAEIKLTSKHLFNKELVSFFKFIKSLGTAFVFLLQRFSLTQGLNILRNLWIAFALRLSWGVLKLRPYL